MLRLLHASKHPTTPSPSEPTLTLHVPAYGVLYLPRPSLNTERNNDLADPEATSEAGPSQSDGVDSTYLSHPNELRGELEINIPPLQPQSRRGSGSVVTHPQHQGQGQGQSRRGGKRCKAIRVGWRTVVRLAMGPERGWEEDVIFERDLGNVAGSSEGIWLEEGITRFEFSFLFPPNLAPHDWHPEAHINHDLFAEIEGLPHHHTSHSFFPFRSSSPSSSSSRSASRNRNHSQNQIGGRDRSRGSSPTPGELGGYTASPSISLIRQVDSLPTVPSYEQSEADALGVRLGDTGKTGTGQNDNDWIEGTFKVIRSLRLCYNPNERGEINMLDVRQTGLIDGLGVWHLQYRSWPWTVSAVLAIRCDLNPSPATTIFQIRVSLIQTILLRSPRDAGPHAKEKELLIPTHHVLAEAGKRPPSNEQHPGKNRAAIWRGVEAGGTDDDEWNWEERGRMPNDRKMRPSTIEGIETPVRVNHQLLLEVLFSVYGEDGYGVKLKKGGPGELRRMKVLRDVVVPACPIIPQVVSLPSYPTHSTTSYMSPNHPCPLCHTRTEDKLCTSCPPSPATPSHPRHDHPPELVGNKDGICPMCSTTLLPLGEPGTKNCACSFTMEEMWKMGEGRVWGNTGAAASESEVGSFAGGMGGKVEEEERGRRMRR